MQLQKASITTWDHYSRSITLTPTWKKYTIPFAQFARANGVTGQFKAEDLSLIAFYVNGRSTNMPFGFEISDIKFGSPGVPNEEAPELPETVALHQNYPNPFNPSTAIGFDLPEASKVRLEVFDLLGKKVATVTDGFYAAGRHTATFDAAHLPSGTYLYRLIVGQQVITHKMTLVK